MEQYFGLVGTLLINFTILQILYNFIVSKKNNKTRTAIIILVSLVLIGISIGTILVGLTSFEYVEGSASSDRYNFEMTENLKINEGPYQLIYKVNDSSDVEIVFEHPKNYEANFFVNDEIIHFVVYENGMGIKAIKETIEDINNKIIQDYSEPKLYVYSNDENIRKLMKNSRGENNLILTEPSSEEGNNLILTEPNN